MKILNKQNCDHELGLMLIDNNIECCELPEPVETVRPPALEYFNEWQTDSEGDQWVYLAQWRVTYPTKLCVRVKDYNRALDLYACLLDSDE